jgi:hypothetical protein
MTNLTMNFPKGARFNAKYFPKCNKTALETKGPDACPRKSKVGGGIAQGDARPIVPNAVDAKVTLFNGESVGGNSTMLIYGMPELGPPVVAQAVIRATRSGPFGYVVEVSVPAIATLPGAPNAAISMVDVSTIDLAAKRGGRARHLIEAPRLCTGTFFMLNGAVTYEGGLRNTLLERFTIGKSTSCP